MKTIFAILILAAALLLGHHTHAHSIFPSVSELEAALFIHPGALLPKLVVTKDGIFHPRYVSATSRGNGDYNVIVRLDRN